MTKYPSDEKNQDVNKNYFHNLLSRNILDFDFHNTFLNFRNFYSECIFNFCFPKFFYSECIFLFYLLF